MNANYDNQRKPLLSDAKLPQLSVSGHCCSHCCTATVEVRQTHNNPTSTLTIDEARSLAHYLLKTAKVVERNLAEINRIAKAYQTTTVRRKQ